MVNLKDTIFQGKDKRVKDILRNKVEAGVWRYINAGVYWEIYARIWEGVAKEVWYGIKHG